jgi:hypothetical protein
VAEGAVRGEEVRELIEALSAPLKAPLKARCVRVKDRGVKPLNLGGELMKEGQEVTLSLITLCGGLGGEREGERRGGRQRAREPQLAHHQAQLRRVHQGVQRVARPVYELT